MDQTKHLVGILIITSFLWSCNAQTEKKVEEIEVKKVSGPFMDMEPTSTPKLLAPEILASSLEEYNGTFSPDGTEFFFTTNTPTTGIITYTKLGDDNNWTQPTIASFSGKYSEYDPIFSPDGSRLYFSSERPTTDTVEQQRTNIWYVNKTVSGWTDPILVPLSDEGDYYSSLTNSGNIYFNIWNNGDLFKAVPNAAGYEVERLPEPLNSNNGEGDPFISPDEDYIIFRGYNNTLGNGDLYISFKLDEKWTTPENLGEPINSTAHEMCPLVTTDGRFFIFSSSRTLSPYKSEPNANIQVIREQHLSYNNGELNIYYMSSDFISKFKDKHSK